jgi:hypothetical protein
VPKRILYALDALWGHRAVAVLVLLSSAGVIWLGVADRQQSECNARYNERQAHSQRARAAAADADREALNTLVRSLVDDNPSDGREQVRRYLEAIDRTNAERERNPVPPPPPDLCK